MKKKLRELTRKLRTVLEDSLRGRLVGRAATDLAWLWAIRLCAQQAMTVRGITGDLPPFLCIADSAEYELSAEVLQCCRKLLADSKVVGRGPESEVFADPLALGWLHQYWHDVEREVIAKNAGRDQPEKIAASAIIPATQVYSERYMSEFLLENSLGALWLGMHPDSRLTAGWQYYVNNSVPLFSVRPAATIAILDPACGSGHFLLTAFDMIYDMYQEEAQRQTPESICASILNNNLFGIDIDAKAVAVARTALWLKAKEKAPALKEADLVGFFRNIITTCNDMSTDAADLGSLLQVRPGDNGPLALLLSRSYDVVVSNPPYIDKRDYAKVMRSYLRRHYHAGAGNLYAAFILRCLSLADKFVGMITPQTFLFLTSYASLREIIFQQSSFRTLAHLGLGAFEDAVVDTAMFVMTKNSPDLREATDGVYIKLLDAAQKDQALLAAVKASWDNNDSAEVYRRSLKQVTTLEGSPVAYWLGDRMLAILKNSRPLRDYADIVLGMKTSDNKRFVRFWWEIEQQDYYSQTAGWAPYEKETSGYRFQRNSAHYVRWTDGARRYYQSHYSAQLPNSKYWFRPGIVFGLVSSKAFTAKLLPGGHMTDMAASCIFPHNEEDTDFFLGMLNSKMYQCILNLYNPTVNYQPVDVQRLPVPDLAAADKTAIGVLATAAAQVVGALREMEITDRNYRFAPAVFLPLSRRLPEIIDGILLNALRYVLARDAIDLKLAEILQLPERERQSMMADLGEEPCGYQLIKGYEALPPDIGPELLVAPTNLLNCSLSELAAIKLRLRQLYTADITKVQTASAEVFFESLAYELKLHPLTVYRLINEGTSQEGWHCNFLEKRLTEDFFSALVLTILGHKWPNASVDSDVRNAGGVVPLSKACGVETMLELIREAVAVHCDPVKVEADFARIVGDNLESWLINSFFKRHISQFNKRPVVWQIASRPGRGAVFSCMLYYNQAQQLPQIAGKYIAPQLLHLQNQSTGSERQSHIDELRSLADRLERLKEYTLQAEHGVRVNIAPLQQAGILAVPVLSPEDVARAVVAFRDWRASFL